MRDHWLDTLRATAISSVVLYHVVQMCPVPLAAAAWTHFGALGVDLFFVLSGWLIGTLYWKEHAARGRVALLNFWQRRWWRTLPAYYAALALSWLAVFVTRKQALDWQYLLFVQNYMERIPFFLVSWSLCIEEHFYLFLPPLIWAWSAARLRRDVLFLLLICSPLLMRFMVARHGISPEFGYDQTATHLRMEGLLLGFATSALALRGPEAAMRLQRAARLSLVPLGALAVWSAATQDEIVRYVVSSTAVALALNALLLAGAGAASSARSLAQTLIQRLALISYSVYLTHALVIHIARSLSERFALGTAAYLVLAPCLILIVGFGFYKLIEQPSLLLRERFVPRESLSRAHRAEL